MFKRGQLYRESCDSSVNRATQLCNENIVGGHLCTNRITNRIITKFSRPGLTKDVRRHCASFDACQPMAPRGRFNKPKETCKVAMQEFGKASEKASHHFDKKAKHRVFTWK